MSYSPIQESLWTQICEAYQIPLSAQLIPFVGDSNQTYKIKISQHNQQVLRIYRTNGAKNQEIDLELKVLSYLNQYSQIKVASPLINQQGKFLTLISDQDHGEIRVAMFSFVNAQTVTNSLSVDLMFKIGQTLGKLDLALEKANLAITPSPSKVLRLWDGEDLINWSLQQFTKYYFHHQFLQDHNPQKIKYSIFELAQRLRNNYRQIKTLLPHQLIHADAHFDNFLWDGKDLSIIDFDNLGYGMRIYELTAPLYHLYELNLAGKLNDIEQDLDLLNQTLISGYLSSVQISNLELKSLPLIQGIHLWGILAWMVKSQDLIEYQSWLEKYGEISMQRIYILLEQHEQQLSFSKLLNIIRLEPTNIIDKLIKYIQVIFQKFNIYLHNVKQL